MLESSEVVDLILTAGMLTFFLWDRGRLGAFPAFGTVLALLVCLSSALPLTAPEGFFWADGPSSSTSLIMAGTRPAEPF